MRLILIVLFLATFTVSVLSYGHPKQGGSHHTASPGRKPTYPASPGKSGSGGGHTYPASPGKSGSGGGHAYPPSPGKSGSGGGHTYPPSPGKSGSGGGHTYPASPGKSGTSNSGNVRLNVIPFYGKNNSVGGYTHPAPPGKSAASNSGYVYQNVVPRNVQQTYHPKYSVVQHKYRPRSEVHHHYHYSPPQQITYGSTYHGLTTYPVYQGRPPVYVYEYRDSGSRFDKLLTGLALYNLGRNSHSHHYSSERQYSGAPGEICKLGISKRNGYYEETRIDCNLMSSFIWESENTTSATPNEQYVVKNTTEVKVTQTVNGTGNSSVTTVSVTSYTVEDALKVQGPSIAVTPDMTCYMIRTFRDITALRKPIISRQVDCGLLQKYARSSLYRSVAECLMPHKTIMFNFLMIYLVRFAVF